MTPYKVRLIKKTNGSYEWKPITNMSGGATEIETWKGIYTIDCNPKLRHRCTIFAAPPVGLRFGTPHRNTWRQCWSSSYEYAVWHPIKRKWVTPFENVLYSIDTVCRSIEDDIIEWVKVQPPQPDYKQAEKDRVEVEQTFLEM